MIRAKRESPLHEITRNCSWFRHVNWKAQKTTITKPSPIQIELPFVATRSTRPIITVTDTQTTPPATPFNQVQFNE